MSGGWASFQFKLAIDNREQHSKINPLSKLLQGALGLIESYNYLLQEWSD
jgi:hypothetical protein